ncbi:hypothetical protein GCM10027589_09670 [Actinocorallia lasiicapitis]
MSILRRGAPLVLATAASRLTGLARTAAVLAAFGAQDALRNAYATANLLPNLVFELVAGGMLAAVVVPLLVRAASDEVAEKLLSLIVYLLAPLTVLAVLAAGPIVGLLDLDDAQRPVTVTLARILLPQLFFYGMSALLAAVLNARRRFTVPLWAPIANNLVVIALAGCYALSANLTVLAVGTTAGVAAQLTVLALACRRAGFRPRLRLDPRGIGVRALARTALWTLGSVAVTQAVAFTTLGLTAKSTADFSLAYTIFQVPYALVAVTAITGLTPRMTAAAVGHDLAAVTADLSRALRLTGLALVPASALLFVGGPALAPVLLPHFTNDAALTGSVLAAYAFALVPFSAFQIMQRVFFALGDTRTPALLSAGVALTVLALSLLMPRAHGLPVLIAGVTAVAYAGGAVVSGQLLRRRLGRMDGHRVVRLHAGLTAAASAAVVLYALAA